MGGSAIWYREHHLVLTSSHFLRSRRLVVAACTGASWGGERKGGSNFRTPSLVHWRGEHRPVMSCTRLHGETAGPLPPFP